MDYHLLAGKVEEANRLVQRGLAHARERHMRGEEARALWLLGEIAMRRDPLDIARAEFHYHRTRALARELGMRPLQAHCHLDWVGCMLIAASASRGGQSYTPLSRCIVPWT